MAAPAIRPTKTVSSRMQAVKAESLRLRLDFLRQSIRFSLTVSEFPEAKPASANLRESCRRSAHKSYEAIRSALSKPEFEGVDISVVMPQLRELEANLAALDRSCSAMPTIHAVATALKPVCIADLTQRETEVLRRIACGHSTKEIAYSLGMSFKTAACHRYRLMDKLGIHDAVRLTHYAVQHNLVRI